MRFILMRSAAILLIIFTSIQNSYAGHDPFCQKYFKNNGVGCFMDGYRWSSDGSRLPYILLGRLHKKIENLKNFYYRKSDRTFWIEYQNGTFQPYSGPMSQKIEKHMTTTDTVRLGYWNSKAVNGNKNFVLIQKVKLNNDAYSDSGSGFLLGVVGLGLLLYGLSNSEQEDIKACMRKCSRSREQCVELCTQ